MFCKKLALYVKLSRIYQFSEILTVSSVLTVSKDKGSSPEGQPWTGSGELVQQLYAFKQLVAKLPY